MEPRCYRASCLVQMLYPEILWDVGLCNQTTATFHIQTTMEILVACKCIRVDQIPLLDMLHNADSLQSIFDYKAMHCHSNMVPLTVDRQPDELEKLTMLAFALQLMIQTWLLCMNR